MLTLAIRYLNGWAMAAADGAKKEQAEWPPHPDRVFMALAAAWFETGEDPVEEEALRWLESQPAPAIAASDASLRSTVTSYVPVNDTSTPFENEKKGVLAMPTGDLPIGRPRRPRAFPVAIPYRHTVHLVWDEPVPDPYRVGLERLLGKMTHVGHSASLVQAWIEARTVEPDWVPVSGLAQHRLRVPYAGRLNDLKRLCNRDAVLAHADLTAKKAAAKGKEKKMIQATLEERFGDSVPRSLRPDSARWQGYDRPQAVSETTPSGNLFDPRLLILRLTGKRLSLPATLKLTAALRGGLMKSCPDQPPPEWFSGHTADSRPSADPHLALLPLPFVGASHADGRIMGVALAMPACLDFQEAARCLEPFLLDDHGLPAQRRLFDGRWLECGIELEHREKPPIALKASRWTAASRTWASVTPVVLDRHHDGKDKWERAAEELKSSCERIGLPRPREVMLHPVSLVEGVPHTREFPHLTRKSDGGRRHHSHAVLIFDEPVRGPVMIGAGRFRGYGLCLPMDQGSREK